MHACEEAKLPEKALELITHMRQSDTITSAKMFNTTITVETYDKKTYDKKSRPSNSKKIIQIIRKPEKNLRDPWVSPEKPLRDPRTWQNLSECGMLAA